MLYNGLGLDVIDDLGSFRFGVDWDGGLGILLLVWVSWVGWVEDWEFFWWRRFLIFVFDWLVIVEGLVGLGNFWELV